MQQPAIQHELLTFPEAMRLLRVSRSTLYRLMRAGTLKGHKVGNTWRFYPDDLKAAIAPTMPGKGVGDGAVSQSLS